MTKYDRLLNVTAEAVETLVAVTAGIDSISTVTRILKTEPRIWGLLPKDTVRDLGLLGLKQPHESAEPSGEGSE